MNKKILGLALVATFSTGVTQAAQITYNNNGYDVNGGVNSGTPWSDTSALTKFDASLFGNAGDTVTLNSVSTYFSAQWTGTWAGRNESQNIASFGTDIFLGSDDVSVAIQATSAMGGWNALRVSSDNVGGYTLTNQGQTTGIINVGGIDGDFVNTLFVLTSGDTGFNDYLGAGSFDVDFQAGDVVTVSQSGNGAAQSSNFFAEAGIFVTYDYTVTPQSQNVPEPASLALMGLGLGLMGVARRNKKA